MRIGHGYDAHRFEAGKPLVLGGVKISHDYGLLAHSDGDVLLHASVSYTHLTLPTSDLV